MGTNFYLTIGEDVLHIGKSSAGWKFMFHKIEGKAESYPQWLELLLKGEIHDEYGEVWGLKDFLDKVQAKQKDMAQHYEGMTLVDGYNFMEGEFQ